MANFDIRVGMAFNLDGRRVEFDGRSHDIEQRYLFVDGGRVQTALSSEEFEQLYEEHRLREWQAYESEEAGKSRLLRWEAARDTDKMAALRIQDYCMAWAEKPGTSLSARTLLPLIAAVHRRRVREAEVARVYEPPPPCHSSLQKWIRRWRDGAQTSAAVLARHGSKGNRRPKLGMDVRELMLEHIDEHYLTRKRLPVAEVYRMFRRKLNALSKSRSAAAQIQIPSLTAMTRAISELCSFTVAYMRQGPEHAKLEYRAIVGCEPVTYANEVWEIDDTRVDLICTNPDGTRVIGRPWLIVAIDRFTRAIMAVSISFNPPDTSDVLETLKLAMARKADYLATLGISGEYAASGRPMTIHVDNGKHYNSNALKEALNTLGISHRTMPVLKAWYKGTVERAIGTLSRRVFHVVPGTTFSNIYERDGQTPPTEVARTSIDQLRVKLWRWLVEDYQHTHHRGIDDKPAQLWKSSLTTSMQRLPVSTEALDAALGLTEARFARKTGLQYRNLIFNSDDVLKVRMLPKAQQVAAVIIRINPADLTVVHFMHPVTGEWLPAFLRKDLLPRVEGRNLKDYELACALRRSRSDEFGDNDPDFVETFEEVDLLRDKQAKSHRLSERVKAEAARDRQIRDASHRTRPVVAIPVHENGEFSNLVEKEATEGVVPEPQSVASAHASLEEEMAEFIKRTGLESAKKESR